MKIFRNQAALRIFSLVTGAVFLNMSFFLAEVCMLEITDKQMIENVCNLVLNGGLEEERDGHAGGSSEGDVALKMFSLAGDHLLLHHSSVFLNASKTQQEAEDHYRHANHARIYSPPPDLL